MAVDLPGMDSTSRARVAPVLALLSLVPSLARAQLEPPRPVDELAPDVPGARPVRRPARPAVPVEDRTDSAVEPGETAGEAPPVRPTRREAPAQPRAAAPAASTPSESKPASPERPRGPPPPLVVPSASDDTVLSAFRAWQDAERVHDAKASAAARGRLLELRDTLAIDDLASVSAALLRGARVRAVAHDGGGAVDLAQNAVTLSPDLASARWGLFQAHLADDWTQLSRLVDDARAALRATAGDPWWLRGMGADLGAALLVAWLATTLAVLGVLALRAGPSLVHDVHHRFPRGVATWQAGALLVLLLLVPVVFRAGLMLSALVVFAAMTLYLRPSERWLCLVLLGGMALIPPLAGVLVEATTFAGTAAEDVFQLDRGGLEAAESVPRVRARLDGKKASHAEAYALARYQLRRGRLAEARAAADAALALRPNDARALTLLGNAAFAETRWAEAIAAYVRASEADGSLPEPLWNVSKVYRRRAKTLADDAVGPELDRAQNAAAAAQRIDESLLQRKDPPDEHADMNLLLLVPRLSPGERAPTDGAERRTRVTAQLAQSLVGDVDPNVAVLVPLVAAGALAALGFARAGRGVSHACEKCGRAVCRRCDPELQDSSALCHQCVNVYTRRGKVAPLARVNKEMEVRAHQAWQGRYAYGLGLLWSGAGHLFSGVPVRGAVYAFLFAFALAAAVNREGLLRVPGAAAGVGGGLLAALGLLAVTWAASLRHLARERS